ncbi:hypothetical protein FEM48_Zijuj01G0114800 [Ziziphus jujuba var. spinosa]|uniref:Uncharacterized protein n=1 Tax=Ziziphus jujuba var. spinosa TaxID=714518 RepID=A0A978W106_ZIZJJ|nr:hypothetical protein FEM48_Zijuj01G0114800 [Ziziphus jujuba var. spinosa]
MASTLHYASCPKILPYRCCTLSALHNGSLSAHSSSPWHSYKSLRVRLTSSDQFMFLFPIQQVKPSPSLFLCMASLSNVDNDGVEDPDAPTSSSSNRNGSVVLGAKGSGTTARGRRLLKLREEKRKREYDQLHNYPAWAKVLEDACRDDAELRAVLGDSIGNPDLMRKRILVTTLKLFNPIDSYIWFELFGSPSDRDVDLIGSVYFQGWGLSLWYTAAWFSRDVEAGCWFMEYGDGWQGFNRLELVGVIQSWYVMGRLGAFNSTNLQLANTSMEFDPLYDADKGFKALPSSFHDISDVEFQDNWGRVWVDLGTADNFAIDVLLNCLTVLSSEYLGIQQIVFGGRSMGDWEEGMTNPEYGYKYYKI